MDLEYLSVPEMQVLSSQQQGWLAQGKRPVQEEGSHT